MKYFTVNTAHKWLNIPDDTLGVYNYWDCYTTAKVEEGLTQEQKDNGQYDHYRNTWWPLVEPVMAMAKRGLTLDHTALQEIRQQAEDEVGECLATVKRFTTNENINLNSPKQKAHLLYEELGFKCGKKTDSGDPSTDQFALDYILRNLRQKDIPNLPVIHALFHRSRWNTIASRYLKPHVFPDGKVHPTIKMGSAETLRLAYAEPPIQQMPKEVRKIYKAAPGKLFVALDYSQLEARILAILSKDTTSLEAFADGRDIHRENAGDLFGAGTEISEEERNYAKSFLYGISYGGKSETLKGKVYCPCVKCEGKSPNTLEISRKDRGESETRWFRKHPAIAKFRRELVAYVKKHSSYTTPFGYKRYFFSPVNSILPEIYNAPMQSTAAGLMNERLVWAHKEELPIAIQMHDEIVMECDEDDAEEEGYELKRLMESVVPQLDGYSFPTDCAIGKNWGEMKEVEL